MSTTTDEIQAFEVLVKNFEQAIIDDTNAQANIDADEAELANLQAQLAQDQTIKIGTAARVSKARNELIADAQAIPVPVPPSSSSGPPNPTSSSSGAPAPSSSSGTPHPSSSLPKRET